MVNVNACFMLFISIHAVFTDDKYKNSELADLDDGTYKINY